MTDTNHPDPVTLMREVAEMEAREHTWTASETDAILRALVERDDAAGLRRLARTARAAYRRGQWIDDTERAAS